ncbi:MAG: hypothetical protein ACLGIP_10730 [Alphaproteobacteria bacterium]
MRSKIIVAGLVLRYLLLGVLGGIVVIGFLRGLTANRVTGERALDQARDTVSFRFGETDVSVRVDAISRYRPDREPSGEPVWFTQLNPQDPTAYPPAMLIHGSASLRNESMGDTHLMVREALDADRAVARPSEAPEFRSYEITDRVGVRAAYVGPDLLGAPVAIICNDESNIGGRFCDVGAGIRPGTTFKYAFNDDVWQPRDWPEMIRVLESTLLTATDLGGSDTPD